MENAVVNVVNTGSDGNAYIVSVGNIKFMLDAGMPIDKIRKANKNKILDIKYVFISHSHKDHLRNMAELTNSGVRYIYTAGEFDYKNMVVCGMEQNHDITCYGYSIDIPQENVMIHYYTDTATININSNFIAKNRKHFWIVECDYTNETMIYNDNNESAQVVLRNRRTRETHLSDNKVIEFFNRKDIKADAVLFVHKSSLNFDKQLFDTKMAEYLPNLKYCVAHNKTIYSFNPKRIEVIKNGYR